MSDDTNLQTIADRFAIAEALTRYARGIDRCDLETLKDVFWADGSTQYGLAPQNAHEWAATVVVALKGMARTSHALTNMLIVLDGARATAETYCTAYHELETDGGMREIVTGGRYLDRLEKREGVWRIAFRLYVLDWNRNGPSTSLWNEGLYAGLPHRGARWPDDPSCAPSATDMDRLRRSP